MSLYDRQTTNFDSYYDPPENQFDSWIEELYGDIDVSTHKDMGTEGFHDTETEESWLNDLYEAEMTPEQAGKVMTIVFHRWKEQQKNTWNWEEKIQEKITSLSQDILLLEQSLKEDLTEQSLIDMVKAQIKTRQQVLEHFQSMIKSFQDAKK